MQYLVYFQIFRHYFGFKEMSWKGGMEVEAKRRRGETIWTARKKPQSNDLDWMAEVSVAQLTEFPLKMFSFTWIEESWKIDHNKNIPRISGQFREDISFGKMFAF